MDVRVAAMSPRGASSFSRQWLIGAAALAVPALAVMFLLSGGSATPLIVLLADGVYPVALLLAATGLGAWPAHLLLRSAAVERQVCLACALGAGILSTLSLVLGCSGLLSQVAAWGMLGLGGLLGMTRLGAAARRRSEASRGTAARRDAARSPTTADDPPALLPMARAVLLAPLGIALGVALFCATVPPGLLWISEGNGYDVLEYHLQAPREYFEAGRIHFLPHNVYAQFPQQVELLYLLLMHLVGGPYYDAAIPAQLLHVAFGGWAAAALAAWSPRGWPRAAATVLAATSPWWAYVGALAYVELALLFFSAVCLGLLLDAIRGSSAAGWRIFFAAGICAGLAAGCKYTAAGLVIAPAAVAVLAAPPQRAAVRLRASAIFLAAAAVAFAPWLVRNWAQTGNPVYPFAYELFGGAAWSAAQADQWRTGHALSGASATIAGRAALAWDELLASAMYGPGLWICSAAALLIAWRKRGSWACVLLGLLGLMAWAGLSHMPGRFALPLTIPAAFLIAIGVSRLQDRLGRRPGMASLGAARRAVPLVAAAGVALAVLPNLRQLFALVATQDQALSARGLGLADAVGRTTEMVRQNAIVQQTPAAARVWIVGDAAVFYAARRIHYTTVFNRDPWLAQAGGRSAQAAVAWLSERQITHVVFSWAEIVRLRRTYGFDELVTREWVAGLVQAGLRRTAARGNAAGEAVWEMFEVPVDAGERSQR